MMNDRILLFLGLIFLLAYLPKDVLGQWYSKETTENEILPGLGISGLVYIGDSITLHNKGILNAKGINIYGSSIVESIEIMSDRYSTSLGHKIDSKMSSIYPQSYPGYRENRVDKNLSDAFKGDFTVIEGKYFDGINFIDFGSGEVKFIEIW